MTRHRRSRPALISAGHRAALTNFVRAYLHEDVLAEYGSALNAAKAFAVDANADERRHAADALDHLASVTDGQALSTLAAFFSADLRAAWVPASAADVRALAAAIRPRSTT